MDKSVRGELDKDQAEPALTFGASGHHRLIWCTCYVPALRL